MAYAQQSHLQVVLYLDGEFQQAQGIGHAGALLPHPVCHGLLGELAFIHKALETEGRLYGVEILTLYVLHEGHLQHSLVVGVAHVGGDHRHTGHTAGLETALTADYLVTAVGYLADRDGLDEPEGTYGSGQFLQSLLVEGHTGLERIGFDLLHGDAEHVGRILTGTGPGDFLVHIAYRLAELIHIYVFAQQGAQAPSEPARFFIAHCVSLHFSRALRPRGSCSCWHHCS